MIIRLSGCLERNSINDITTTTINNITTTTYYMQNVNSLVKLKNSQVVFHGGNSDDFEDCIC